MQGHVPRVGQRRSRRAVFSFNGHKRNITAEERHSGAASLASSGLPQQPESQNGHNLVYREPYAQKNAGAEACFPSEQLWTVG